VGGLKTACIKVDPTTFIQTMAHYRLIKGIRFDCAPLSCMGVSKETNFLFILPIFIFLSFVHFYHFTSIITKDCYNLQVGNRCTYERLSCSQSISSDTRSIEK
jgi:hypothetical protein